MTAHLQAPESGYRYGVKQSVLILDCANCGIMFGITKAFEERRREDHQGFYCPNGHSNVYRGDNEAEKLRKELERKQDSLTWERDRAGRLSAELGQTKAKLTSTKAAKTRIKRERDQIKARIAEGVCPVPGCRRSGFSNVKLHIHYKHPDFNLHDH